jgi:hypothetical protein
MTTPIMHPIALKLIAIPGVPLFEVDAGLDWALLEAVGEEDPVGPVGAAGAVVTPLHSAEYSVTDGDEFI